MRRPSTCSLPHSAPRQATSAYARWPPPVSTLGEGSPRKILPALRTPTFLDAFKAKAPMHALVEAMPVSVILEEHAALLGAAVAAQGLSLGQI